MDYKELLISGPINVVRVEGTVNNIKKVLHIYFDIHLDVNEQTQCEELRAKNIKDHFVQSFDKVTGSDKSYDFFLEILPATVQHESILTHTKYVWELQELFKKSFSYDAKKQKVMRSSEFPNVRLHYIDIREYIETDARKLMDSLIEHSHDILDNKIITQPDIKKLRSNIKALSGRLKTLNEIIFGNKQLKADYVPTIPEKFSDIDRLKPLDLVKKTHHLINKIKGSYTHKNIKDIITDYINTHIRDDFRTLFSKLNKLNNFLIDMGDIIPEEGTLYVPPKDDPPALYSAKFGYYVDEAPYFTVKIASIYEQVFEINLLYMDALVKLVDMYFLRRFLDKDYITNAAIYVGAHHAVHYISFLVKYFNFKITHGAVINEDNLDELHSIIKKEPFDYVARYFNPDILYQCSDISDFPDLFE
jgi:hypothetical protein